MPAKRRSKRWWCKVVDRYEARKDEVTLKQFAAEEDLNCATFISKVYRIRKARRSQEPSDGGGDTMQFVPVDVVGLPAAGPLVARPHWHPENWLEAETPAGLKLRFCEGSGSEYVADLVRRFAGGQPC